MNALLATGTLLGGLGLLLIGMSMMADGLKLAAGHHLRDILARWTNTRLRGLAAGFLVTALVQSSSAVTVAAIGFANAGVLTLEQCMWVIFGSNVGTTMTAWIVTLVGFQLNIEAIALPVIGVGMILKLTGKETRKAFFGNALIGFGLLLVGIGVLKEVFDGIGADLSMPPLMDSRALSIVVFVVVGMLLTTLMQSSSAALVVALSAAEGGMIPLETAAAIVIGANLGTTTTAVLAVWDATSPAKRVALTHVLFNVVTASVAMLLLAPMLFVVGSIQSLFNLDAAPAVTLALFHTAFNVLGVALIWPLSPRLVAFVAGRFQTQEELESRPRFLDRTIIGLSQIAIVALTNEVARLNALTVSSLTRVLSQEQSSEARLTDEELIARNLADAVGTFSAELSRTQLPPSTAELLPNLLRAAQQFSAVIDSVREIRSLHMDAARIDDRILQEALVPFLQSALDVVAKIDVTRASMDAARLDPKPHSLEDAYDALKIVALRRGARGEISVNEMDIVLRYASAARRAVSQAIKATRRLVSVRTALRLDDVELDETIDLSEA